jgi:sugar lactone lactonase YvrE
MKGYRCLPTVLLLVACTPTPDVRATFTMQAVTAGRLSPASVAPASAPPTSPVPTSLPTGRPASNAPTPTPSTMPLATVAPSPAAGPVSTVVAGLAIAGDQDGPGASATFSDPGSLAIAPDGALWVADRVNHNIRRLVFDAEGDATVTTIAGSSSEPGFLDGAGKEARFDEPAGLAIDARGVVYVADPWNHRIRRIEPGGSVDTLVGGDVAGGQDGSPSSARFDHPYGLALDTRGHLFVTERFAQTLRMVTLDTANSRAVWVGTVAGSYDQAGSNDGHGSSARFDTPIAVAVEAPASLIVAEAGSCLLRRVAVDDMGSGTVTTLNAGMSCGFADGPIATARFEQPAGLVMTPDFGLLLTDASGGTLRRIAGQPLVASTLLGGSAEASNGSGPSQTFGGIARAADGSLYVSDGNLIRRIRL